MSSSCNRWIRSFSRFKPFFSSLVLVAEEEEPKSEEMFWFNGFMSSSITSLSERESNSLPDFMTDYDMRSDHQIKDVMTHPKTFVSVVSPLRPIL